MPESSDIPGPEKLHSARIMPCSVPHRGIRTSESANNSNVPSLSHSTGCTPAIVCEAQSGMERRVLFLHVLSLRVDQRAPRWEQLGAVIRPAHFHIQSRV